MRRILFVLLSLAISLTVYAENHAVIGQGQGADKSSFLGSFGLKKLFVSEELLTAKDFPKTIPFEEKTVRFPKLSEITTEENAGEFVRKLLAILKEEQNQIIAMLPEKLRTPYLFQDFENLTILNLRNPAYARTETFQSLSLEDFQDRKQLREKLMSHVMNRAVGHGKSKFFDDVRENPERYNDLGKSNGYFSGPLQATAVSTLFAGLESPPVKAPALPYSPETVLSSAVGYRESAKHAASGDTARASYFKKRADQQRAREEVDPEKRFNPTGYGLGEVTESFLSSLEGKEKIPQLRKRWIDYVLQHLDDPSLYRVLLHNGDYNGGPQIDPSLDLLFDGFAKTLSPTEAALFKKGRADFKLTRENLQEYEISQLSPQLTPQQFWKYIPALKSQGESPLAQGMGTPPFGAGKHAGSIVDAEAVLRDTVTANGFTVTRGLMTYFTKFDDVVAGEVLKLGGQDHWVDMGSGEGIAIEDYVAGRKPEGLNNDYRKSLEQSRPNVLSALDRLPQLAAGDKAFVTGITKEIERTDIPTYDGKLTNLTGRWLEDIPNEEITKKGKAMLITDMFGVFPYAPQADETLKKYLHVLDPKGKIFIYFPKGAMTRSQVTVNGTSTPMLDWVKSLESAGLKVTIHSANESRGTVEIKFAPGASAESVTTKIPKLKLISADGDQPPLRKYEQVK